MTLEEAPDKIMFTDIVQGFPCSGSIKKGSLELNMTDYLSTDLQIYVGRGILLKLNGTDQILGYGVIHLEEGELEAEWITKDITAVC